MLTGMAESGPIALVGSGEFLPAMAEIDAGLLAATGRRRPRVAILPTASWPDGEDVFRRWAEMGVEHFTALGAEVEPVLVRDRFDADDAAHVQAIGEADLVYLSGGKPGHLTRSIVGSPVGDALLAAHARGATLAGCSAGAMTLATRHWDTRRRRLFWPLGWRNGLGLVPGATVIPHYDAFPEPVSAMIVLQAPRGLVALGVDEETALIGRDGAWQVQGQGRVTVWRGRHRTRYRRGEVFRL
jgi:cyanophycinase-like exopeptidase